jgi:hypothetical protein
MHPKSTPTKTMPTSLELTRPTLIAALAAVLFAAALAAGCKPTAEGAKAGANANAQASQSAAGATTAAPAQSGGTAAAPAASPVAPGQSAATAQSSAPVQSPATNGAAGGGAHGGNATAPGAPHGTPAATAAAAARPLDPCALITAEEIKAVQGEAVRDVKGSRRTDTAFAVADCFYTTPTYTKSVSLEVTQRGSSGVSVREFWKTSFERAEQKREKKNERRKKQGRAQAGPPARPVEGIGDEAYWVSTNANSTLYAFKNDSLLRISIGGPQPEAERMRKIKDLALKALARM